MAGLDVIGIRKAFGAQQVLDGIDLSVADGEFCVFVGPSGCGKSTLLRVVAGLDGEHEGAVRIGGRDVTRTAPADRGVAMVFQSYALYPHMSVAENIGFGLRMRGLSRAGIAQKVDEAARLLQLGPLLQRRPAELSGGQRQRVALGRAIVRDPDLFLFDEPLSNLDAGLRTQMRIELTRLHRQLKATMIFVTHDQTEAMTMADRIVVLNAGRVEQVGTPMQLYTRPRNVFVARFIGSPRMNLVPATLDGGSLRLAGGGVLALASGSAPAQGSVSLGVRPETMALTGPAGAPLAGEIALVEQLGGESIVHVAVAGIDDVLVKIQGVAVPKVGERVGIAFDAARAHLFDAAGTAMPHAPAPPPVAAKPAA